jgi:hypothetical protein
VGHLGLTVIFVLVALALLAGIRGAFAYHKLPPKPEYLPTIADSFKSVKDSSHDPDTGR